MEHRGWHACDIDRMPDDFAGIAWNDDRASDIAQAVFERTIRKGCDSIVITGGKFALVFMLYDSQHPSSPDVQIVFGKPSEQQLLEAIAEALLDLMNQPGRKPVPDDLKARAELIVKLLKTGLLDDGTPVSRNALNALLRQTGKPGSLLH
ncbi:hypothetical protein R75461_08013 [Paraburkholderia nemoris]|uniref:hypothetical protein n=1 Tax=Paraburkholderia nemoris TaxID=2793076 RepID=UPI00190A4199|nr:MULTISPECIES: hypothetical protein [Paraburkholderia]MBK3786779.1 hypothetical protein [Paraburkholderia aspalathi]CAE6861604.1 hypothetical protein R75461_08013 [Paraburkholderia nemoris]